MSTGRTAIALLAALAAACVRRCEVVTPVKSQC
jgi:hypothetical protein